MKKQEQSKQYNLPRATPMCGRFTLKTPAPALIEHFGLGRNAARQLDLFQPRYNIAPTQDVWVVRVNAQQEREVVLLRWGLVPSWTKELSRSSPLINARGETVAEKPSFRSAFRRRRCLAPADGFYEWKPAGKRKQPYYIHRLDGRPFALAALWESWDGTATGAGPYLESCTLITTTANRLMSSLHDRMPVIIEPSDYELWLDPEVQDPAQLAGLVAPLPDGALQADPVSDRVNRPTHDDPQCIEPLPTSL